MGASAVAQRVSHPVGRGTRRHCGGAFGQGRGQRVAYRRTPIVAGRFLAQALSKIMTDNPDCMVELRTGLVHELRTMLERDQVDLVLGPQSLADPVGGEDLQRLSDDRVGILCRVDHPLTHRKTIMPSDLEAQAWLAHSRGSQLRQQTEAAMAASGVNTIHIVCETDSIRSVLDIVSSTDLMTTLPRATTAPYLEGAMTFLDFDHPQSHRPLGLIRRWGRVTDQTDSRFVRVFRELRDLDLN